MTRYAIVFLDWRMPDLDGTETARRIAAMPLETPPRLVMVTAYGREDVVSRSRQRAGSTPSCSSPSARRRVRRGDARHSWARALLRSGRSYAVRHPETTDSARLRGARVLLVEDNELNQQVALELLGAAGVQVAIASNGEQGVRCVQETAYDLVLMDLQMPVMDGLEATRRIRALPGFATLPILAMTANAMSGDRQRSLEAGMNDHITKPIDPDQLFDVLLRWLPEERSRFATLPTAAPPPASIGDAGLRRMPSPTKNHEPRATNNEQRTINGSTRSRIWMLPTDFAA